MTTTDVLQGKTILQVIPELETGGAERTTLHIAAALTRAGARALVVSEGGRLLEELKELGGVFHPAPMKTKNPLRILWNALLLARLIRTENAALVHARSRAPAWSCLIAARLTDRPFVTTYHGIYNENFPLKRFYNSIMARGDSVIANSHYTANVIGRAYRWAIPRVRVIYRGIDLRVYNPNLITQERIDRLRADWGVEKAARVIFLPARITRWKGQEVLISAAEILHAKGLKNTIFILAGDAQGRQKYVHELKTQIAKKQLTEIVRLVGHVVDVPAAIAAADVVTITSTAPEAFGRTAVEAQAIGKPVIVSDLGAVSETVLAPPETPDARRTGWRVPANDPTALASAIERALALSPTARRAQAARSQNHVRRHFSREKMSADTLDAYIALLTTPRLE